MPAAWHQGQGANGQHEGDQAFERFQQFLEMGGSRSVAELAKILGITRQSLGETARKFNWVSRAAAYDKANGGRNRTKVPAAKPPSSRPEALPPRTNPDPSSNPRPQRPPAITPEVLNPQAAALAEGHLQHLKAYHALYLELGQAMAGEAKAALPIVRQLLQDFDQARQAWRQLVDAKEIQLADLLCRQLIQIAPLYYKMSETMHAHANQGRLHWGDAIGVGKVVEEALKLREQQGLGR